MNRVRLAHVLDYCRRRALAPDAVLEIGPGHGMFARHLLALRPTTRYWAVETDLSCRPTLDGMGVRVLESVQEMPSDAPPFDLAIASHVLEHVADPCAFVSAMLGTLRPGGVLFLEVPCRDHEHKALDEPHLLFFDKPAMLRLLTDLGADQVELSYHGIPLRQLTHPWHRFGRRIGRLMTRVGVRASGFGAARPDVFADPALAEEWEVVRPFRAHETSTEPAWWLRAVAVKT
ncbi:MAG: class I SAM-dependent methyltransferase [Gemmatimonadetes bacterium]|nr:class I SAM-dependent methyltransferase [Gemmatimonadota bacterium]